MYPESNIVLDPKIHGTLLAFLQKSEPAKEDVRKIAPADSPANTEPVREQEAKALLPDFCRTDCEHFYKQWCRASPRNAFVNIKFLDACAEANTA